MIADDSNDQEGVLIVESPLSELLDETIRVYREPAWPDQVVVDERHRAFFEAVKVSLAGALARIDQIEFADLDDDHE
jgi:hypothetical protein